MDEKVWLSSPHMGGTELDFIHEAFAAGWIAPLGPQVDGFELDLEQFVGARHAAALSSGTAALHLALIIAGVKQGDTVLCQSFTFSASANPIVYQGAVPVFIDSEPVTWNMCPELLEKAILEETRRGKKPKAIVVVHLYGMPARMNELRALADRYQIVLIEDAAEALGSTYHGQHCGALSTLGVLSFNGNKIITTSGGGALVSENEEYIRRARYLATQARDEAPHYQHSVIGYNYRMSNVSAAIGRGQMKVLNLRVEQRRKNFAFYKARLEGLPGITFLEEPAGSTSNRWLTTLLISPGETRGINAAHIGQRLAGINVESRPLWKPMHLQPVFSSARSYLSGCSEHLFERGLCLPSGSNLSEDVLDKICNEIVLALP